MEHSIDETRPPCPGLLTAKQVAWSLLEALNLVGWRTNGREGLQPCQGGLMYRPQDVESIINRIHNGG